MYVFARISDDSAAQDLLADYARAYEPLKTQIAKYLKLPENHSTLHFASFSVDRFKALLFKLSDELQTIIRQRLQQLPRSFVRKQIIKVEGNAVDFVNRPIIIIIRNLT